jgi:hypothetical protein
MATSTASPAPRSPTLPASWASPRRPSTTTTGPRTRCCTTWSIRCWTPSTPASTAAAPRTGQHLARDSCLTTTWPCSPPSGRWYRWSPPTSRSSPSHDRPSDPPAGPAAPNPAGRRGHKPSGHLARRGRARSDPASTDHPDRRRPHRRLLPADPHRRGPRHSPGWSRRPTVPQPGAGASHPNRCPHRSHRASVANQASSHRYRGPAVIACGHRLTVARVARTLQPNRSSAAALFALVAADLEAGLETCGPSCNATSLGSSTMSSPCCSSNAAADAPPISRMQTVAAGAGGDLHGRRAASEPASMTAAPRAAVFANLAVDSAPRWRRRTSSC